jgi:hypothetical protein
MQTIVGLFRKANPIHASDVCSQSRKLGKLLTGLCLIGSSVATFASDAAFIAPGGISSGNEIPGPVNLGMVFTPNENILVDGLGFYFAIGLGNSEVVALYDNTSQALLASTTVSVLAPSNESYIYSSISPTALMGGHQYVIDEFVSGSLWAYGNAPSTASGITYDGHTYVYSNQLQFPDSTVDAAGAAYYGPNFTFVASAVPEPGGYTIMISGLVLLVVAARSGLGGFSRKTRVLG